MGRPTTLPEPWRKLAEQLGGVGVLATACGVAYHTVERWARGDFVPKSIIRTVVNKLATDQGVDAPFVECACGCGGAFARNTRPDGATTVKGHRRPAARAAIKETA